MFSRIQDDNAKLQSAFVQVNQLVCLATFPLFAAVALYGDRYIPLFFGEKWLISVPIIGFLSAVGFLEATRSTHESLILATGKSGLRLLLAALLATTNIAMFFAVYQAGIVTLSLTYALIALVLFPFWVYMVLKLTDLPFLTYCMSFKEALVATLIITTIHFALSASDLAFLATSAGFLVEAASLGAVYVGALLILNKPLVMRLVRRKRGKASSR